MTKLRLSPPSLRSACAVAQVIYDITTSRSACKIKDFVRFGEHQMSVLLHFKHKTPFFCGLDLARKDKSAVAPHAYNIVVADGF